jgi:hypothetical protein
MQLFTKNTLAALALALASSRLVSACTGPAINQAALNLIKTFEGFRASPCKASSSLLRYLVSESLC